MTPKDLPMENKKNKEFETNDPDSAGNATKDISDDNKGISDNTEASKDATEEVDIANVTVTIDYNGAEVNATANTNVTIVNYDVTKILLCNCSKMHTFQPATLPARPPLPAGKKRTPRLRYSRRAAERAAWCRRGRARVTDPRRALIPR